MSEGGGSAGPDIGPNYQNSGPTGYSNPPSQPPTPSSTVQDPPNYQNSEIAENSAESKSNLTSLHSNSASGLPPFSSFAASDVSEGLGGRLAGDGYLTSDGITSTRVMELSGWDYCYSDGLNGRYLERGDSMPVMIPQPQYRPWESKQDGSSESIKSTLPSFQSQFGEELVTTLTTLTPAACSPAPSVPSPGLPSFHTLSAVNPRYPLVPAPVQAREIPSIQQQFLDERHIHLFQGPPGQNFTLQPQNGLNGQTLTSLNNGTTLTTLNNAQYHPQIINNAQILPSGQILAPQSHILTPSSQIITSNGHIITSSGGQGLTVVSQNSTPTVLTVVKTEPVNIVELKSNSTEHSNLTQLHHTNFQNPMITQGQHMDSKFGLESPPRGVDGRKKERRKIRASSLESSNESDGAMSVESSGQVAAVSSTAGFKSPMTPGQMNTEGDGIITDTGEKQTKKKRKRCGECIGCQRKDNCGDCAPCRNDKSHQICKMRRCEKLTEKKHLLAYNREDGGVSFRGRGRGRGRGSRGGYRGKGARPGTQSAQVSSAGSEMNSSPGLIVGTNRENIKVDGGRVSSGAPIPGNPALAPTMAVPFYAGTEVWSASTPADPWASQGQFIHQIDDIRYQHYPGYQTTAGYQQTGFITDQTSAFQPQYANTNGNPATSPAQGNVTPRSTGSYTQVHTPTPSPNPPTPHVNGHRNGINVHYVEESYVNGTAFGTDSAMVPPASTTPNSRSSSVHIEGSDTTSKTSGYMSGNEIPGYPLNSPQCQSSCNSSGYPGQSVQSEFGDQTINGNSYQSSNGPSHVTQKSPSYTQASPGTYQNYQNYNQVNIEDHQNAVKSNMSPGNCHPSQKSSGIYTQNSPKSYNSNPSPQNYQEVSSGQNRGVSLYENRTVNNGNIYHQSERYDQQNYPQQSPNAQNYGQGSPSNANQEKSNVNARIKSMIMNKQQISQTQQQNLPNNNFSGPNENQMMSPNREMMSPPQQRNNLQLMQHSPMMTQNTQMLMSPPNHQNQQQQQQQQQLQQRHMNATNNQMISNKSQMNSRESGKSGFREKISQQQTDCGERKELQLSENSNHFLAFSHHLRDGSRLQPEGGGVTHWTESPMLGSNYQFNRIKSNSYDESIAIGSRVFLGKERNRRKENAAGENFAKLGFERKFCDGSEANRNPRGEEYLSCERGVQPRNHFHLADPIRTLEMNFPTRRTADDAFRSTVPGPIALHDLEPSFKKAYCASSTSGTCQYSKSVERTNVSLTSRNNFGCQNFQSCKSENYGEFGCETDGEILAGMNFGCRVDNIKQEIKLEHSLPIDDCEYKNIKTEGGGEDECQFGDPAAILTEQHQGKFKEEGNGNGNENENGNGYQIDKFKAGENVNGNSLYPRILYAPNFKNMEIIDRRFVRNSGSVGKSKWEDYQENMRDKEAQSGETVEKKKENYIYEGEGGPINLKASPGAWCCRMGGTDPPSDDHIKIGGCQGHQTADEFLPETEKQDNLNTSAESEANSENSEAFASQACDNSADKPMSKSPGTTAPDIHKDFQENVDRLRNNLRTNVPECQCFPPDKCPPEPGSYYTHLGAAASLSDLRKDLEKRTGQTGKALRFEKICYTGKEGKTTQGCPLAKWVIRRSGLDEKVLIVVKHRQGHTCSTAWIVVCLVAWEGVPTAEADRVYALLSHKLNKFGLPTTRRCATNEPRTCACQGLNPDTCGASFSFGCSWSMYYNGCKYARSKTVRKFRLSVRSEEQDVEERMHVLATLLSPLYNTLAPDAFHNQTLFEREATECRLGFKPGRPFSGVTACIDFCAHSHRDLHNMNNGCTVVVTLTKHRSLTKPEDEQLHVLPLYVMDDTDEFGCKDSQEAKCKNGSIECLNKFPCEVRVRAVPLQPCRRHGKKRKDEESDGKSKEIHSKLNLSPMGVSNGGSNQMQSIIDLQLQSSQVSSTVMDSPGGQYKTWNYQNKDEQMPNDEGWRGTWMMKTEPQRKQHWMNSTPISSNWEYPEFKSDNPDVNPDSTTNQTCSSRLKGSMSNTMTDSPPYLQYNSSGLVPFNQSPPTWNQQMQQHSMTDRRNFCMAQCNIKSECEDGKIGKMSSRHQGPEYLFNPPHFPQQSDSLFRIPKGAPPSIHHHAFGERSRTYLKPLPNETVPDIYNFSYRTKEEINFNSSKNEILTRNWLNNNAFGSNCQNFQTTQGHHGYCQGDNYFLNGPPAKEANRIFDSETPAKRSYSLGTWPNSSPGPSPLDHRFDDECTGIQQQNIEYPRGQARWDACGGTSYLSAIPESPKSEPIGEVTDFIENEECFRDSQMGGVAIALGHGSVLFECAKHELHATTALKNPNRSRPTRISLVFYQHRNLNRAKHGWDEWEEKMRLRKLGLNVAGEKISGEDANPEMAKLAGFDRPLSLSEKILLRSPTHTTTTWTTLFPMRPCMVTGPYQEGGEGGTRE